MSEFNPSNEIRKLNISDLERIERFRRAGYGGAVSDAPPGTSYASPLCLPALRGGVP